MAYYEAEKGSDRHSQQTTPILEERKQRTMNRSVNKFEIENGLRLEDLRKREYCLESQG